MVKETRNFLSELPKYADPLVVFDKDKNLRFDIIIKEANSSGVQVAWPNPCIEIWLHAYFGSTPNYHDSVKCCSEFSKEYKKKVCQDYHKTDEKLYNKLVNNGIKKIL